MKRKNISRSFPAAAFAVLCVCWLSVGAKVAAQSSGAPGDGSQAGAMKGPGTTLVHSQFGGQIFGFDIDQHGTEGVLSEAQDIVVGRCWLRSKPLIRPPARF
jgi:hypothetical protein